MRIFLDLEETIINNFQEGLFVNLTRIREWLDTLFTAHNVPREVNIFSFAIWNDADLQAFNRFHRVGLERALNIEIGDVPTTEFVLRTVRRQTGVQFDLNELLTVWGKERSFIDFCRHEFRQAQVILLDDTVPNLDIHDKDRDLRIQLVNVDSI